MDAALDDSDAISTHLLSLRVSVDQLEDAILLELKHVYSLLAANSTVEAMEYVTSVIQKLETESG